MPQNGYFAVFLIGLLGGVHCMAMCGGIVSAIGFSSPLKKASRGQSFAQQLLYNCGRITTYTGLGAVFGSIGAVGFLFNQVLPVATVFYIASQLVLMALGLYMAGFGRLLAPLERVGSRLWRRLQPLGQRFLPLRSAWQALPVGLLWGFLPCGMVYSVLSTALVSGSASRGAALMLAFGLGTLPNLILAGLGAWRFKAMLRNEHVRLVGGLLVFGLGVFGLFHFASLGGALWRGVLCLT